jgi:hypothetical protein
VTTERSVFEFLRSRGEEFMNQVTNELMSNPRFIQAMQTALRGKQWVDESAARALKSMNVPTRTEFKRAVARIDALEQELAEVKRQAAAAERSRGAAPKARRAPARKKPGSAPAE